MAACANHGSGGIASVAETGAFPMPRGSGLSEVWTGKNANIAGRCTRGQAFDRADQMADGNDLIGQVARLQRHGNLLHLGLQRVAAAEEFGDDRGIEQELLAAGEVEQRFHFMRELVHRHELQEAGIALEGMKGAKNGIERLGMIRLLVEDEQRRLDLLKVINRLGIKFREQLAVFVEGDGQQCVDAGGQRCAADHGSGRRFGSDRFTAERRHGLGCLHGGDGAGQPIDQIAQLSECGFVERLGSIEFFIEGAVNEGQGFADMWLVAAELADFAQQTVGGDQAVVTTGLG